jgi:hypothetical protein
MRFVPIKSADQQTLPIERRNLLQPPEEASQWKHDGTAEQENRIARVMIA